MDGGTRLKIDGRLTLADGARLSLAATRDPALRAGEVKIGNNVALNLSGIASLDGTPRTLIASGDRMTATSTPSRWRASPVPRTI